MRIMRSILDEIRADLERPHPFAAERVGFVLARMGNVGGTELLVLPMRYVGVRDDEYIADRSVGARIGAGCIRRIMQVALGNGNGVYHVHVHDHAGRPRFSNIDLEDLPPLVRSFQAIAPTSAHGALLLSRDRWECLTWLPGAKDPATRGRLTVIGRPMTFFQSGQNA